MVASCRCVQALVLKRGRYLQSLKLSCAHIMWPPASAFELWAWTVAGCWHTDIMAPTHPRTSLPLPFLHLFSFLSLPVHFSSLPLSFPFCFSFSLSFPIFLSKRRDWPTSVLKFSDFCSTDGASPLGAFLESLLHLHRWQTQMPTLWNSYLPDPLPCFAKIHSLPPFHLCPVPSHLRENEPLVSPTGQPCLPGVVHWHLQEPDLLCPALGYLMPKLAWLPPQLPGGCCPAKATAPPALVRGLSFLGSL